jgi:hypothetical protein
MTDERELRRRFDVRTEYVEVAENAVEQVEVWYCKTCPAHFRLKAEAARHVHPE